MSDDDRDPVIDRTRDIPRMQAALRKAVRLALLQHKRAGNPICVWENGAVVWIPASEIPVDENDTD